MRESRYSQLKESNCTEIECIQYLNAKIRILEECSLKMKKNSLMLLHIHNYRTIRNLLIVKVKDKDLDLEHEVI